MMDLARKLVHLLLGPVDVDRGCAGHALQVREGRGRPVVRGQAAAARGLPGDGPALIPPRIQLKRYPPEPDSHLSSCVRRDKRFENGQNDCRACYLVAKPTGKQCCLA